MACLQSAGNLTGHTTGTAAVREEDKTKESAAMKRSRILRNKGDW